MSEYKLRGPTPVEPLNSTLFAPWNFLHPTVELNGAVSSSAKYFFDSLATSVSGSQQSRLQNARKRKRSTAQENSSDRILQLKQLYVDGFASDQIWEQAARILDSTEDEIKRNDQHDRNLPSEAQVGVIRGSPSSSIEDPEQSDTDDSIGSDIDESHINNDEDIDMESASEGENPPSEDPDEPENEDEMLSEGSMSAPSDDEDNRDTYTEDRFGLNDGFFSIDDFNAQSEKFEKEDARGGPTEEADSDDEEIDWHANPLVPGNAAPVSADKTSKNEDGMEDDEMSDSSEEGPTFGNTNLHGDSDSDEDNNEDTGVDAGGWIDTSNIKYADFFAPPPRKATTKKSRPLPKTQPREADMENDTNRAMADVRRDLFENELSDEDEEVDASLDGTGVPQNQRSTHERQRARITDEIRRLEAANVAKKEWMLSGEARAPERPLNSLIEEDLDFERIGKPVPVVTTEISESIEELIKRRILAKEFDEIIRRRPGTVGAQDSRKPRFELDDSKAQQSLAETYEADHLRATDPNYIDPKNQKLNKEHAEITNLWKEISGQLDTLSNWHYKPKAPQANINVVTDVGTVMMEDARPSAGGAVSESTALAPQEIYALGNDNKAAGEVVLKTGASIAKDEMTREEKAKLRRQQKKQKKASFNQSDKRSDKAAEKQQLVSDLKKGGVKVIGQQGEVTNINGGKAGDGNAKNSGDTLKL